MVHVPAPLPPPAVSTFDSPVVVQTTTGVRRRPGSRKPPMKATSARSRRLQRSWTSTGMGSVANTTFHGVNSLHAAGGLGWLPLYRYLIEEVNMVEINRPDTWGNSFAPFRS